MQQRTILLTSAGLGAATAYLLDPASGNRRRRRIGDALVHAANQTTDAVSTVGRDLRNRTRGVVAGARRTIYREHPDDVVLQERVRSALGRVASRPHGIKVQARNGHVILSGPILAAEEQRIVHAVQSVSGVTDVETRFDSHTQGAGASSLKGVAARFRMRRWADIGQRNWAPATRAVVGTSGAALIVVGTRRRDWAGLGLAVAGSALLARAVTNMEFRRLVGLSAGHRAIDLQKTIAVDVAVERLFAFWDDFTNFPKFMHHVREVRPTKDPNKWHWTVSGASTAAPIEFDAVVTERIPNHVLAWKTVEGSLVGHAGLVRFDAVEGRRTRLQIRLSYNPIGGALTHGVLAVFGADPRSRLDEDLVRMKTALETGRRAHDAAASTLVPQ
jgi:uncharacterized membrane protein